MPFLQNIAKQAIDILNQIHQQGIVHNDIKPHHLIISNNSLFLIDFGAAGKIGDEYDLCTPLFAPSVPDGISVILEVHFLCIMRICT